MKLHYKVILFFVLGCVTGRIIGDVEAREILVLDTLLLLVFLAGMETGFYYGVEKLVVGFKEGVISLFYSIIGSIIGGLPFIFILGKISIVAAVGLGWYTFTGPYMEGLYGSNAGTIGFLSNLTREVFSILAIPFMAKRINCRYLVPMAGAPALDTVFPIIYKYCGKESGISAIVQGLLTTLFVPLLVVFLSQLFL